MADPASLTASIIAILQLSQTVVKYLNDVKDASKERNKLLVEISSINGILHSLKDLAALDEKWLKTVKALDVPNGPLDRFRMALRTLAVKLEPVVGLKKVQKALLWSFDKGEVKEAIAVIERQKSVFILALQNDQMGLSRAIESNMADLKTGLLNIQGAVESLRTQVRDDSELRILEWLSRSQSEKKHNDVFSQRIPGTGTWLLEKEEFLKWCDLRRDASVLWCHGIPGVGKTVLSSLVIDNLKTTFQGQNIGIAYFYCDYRDQEMQSGSSMIAGMLKQLSCHMSCLPSPLLDLYENFRTKGIELNIEILQKALLDVVRQFHHTFIVIDALDECDPVKHRKSFLKVLKDFGNSGIRLFITSRPHPDDIKCTLGAYPQIVIEASEPDIRTFLVQKIDGDGDIACLLDHQLREEIIATITQSAQGMFLLPALQIRVILEQTSRAEIRQAIRTLPRELDKNFEATLIRIKRLPESRAELAMKTLMWITHAWRPLRIDELRHALAVKLGDTELDEDNLRPVNFMVDYCLGLVLIDHESSTIRLVHFTLQEYFQSQRVSIFPLGERMICQTCLTYLCFDVFAKGPCQNKDDFVSRLDIYPFLVYATKYWSEHAREDAESQLAPLMLMFVDDSQRLDSWSQVWSTQGDPNKSFFRALVRMFTKSMTGLHICGIFGLETLAGYLIQNGADLNQRNSYGDTPLHEAVTHERIVVAQLLLSGGADVNAQDTNGRTPLHIAARTSEVLLQELLRHGANPDALDRKGRIPLHKAIGSRIFRLLVEKTTNFNVSDNGGRTILHAAVIEGGGSVKKVRLLLDQGIDVELKDSTSATALHHAAMLDRVEVGRLLLEHGADVNARTIKDETPIELHILGHYVDSSEMIELLLENGADLDRALLAAVKYGNGVRFRFLLRRHDKTSRISRESLLQMAAARGRDEIVDELLSAGACVDGESLALHAAAKYGRLNLLPRLCTAPRADVNLRTRFGITPLHMSARALKHRMIRPLLDRGADIWAKNNKGRTALDEAILKFELSNKKKVVRAVLTIVELLREHTLVSRRRYSLRERSDSYVLSTS